jgi:histidinol-phosphate/aromatic aminotransferase/cobyric acid decarboxylase-like protein
VGAPLRPYPDRQHTSLRRALARHHGLDPGLLLPGNGAAELFTWAARDAADAGCSLLPSPGFADYQRALACWGGAWREEPLPLHWPGPGPQAFPLGPETTGQALWITNPTTPPASSGAAPASNPCWSALRW